MTPQKPKFIPGLKLNEMFYREVVGPLMKKNFPNLKYSAGVVGDGSDVLGLDTPMSTDHNWGPRMTIFLRKRDFKKYFPRIDKMLRTQLPYQYKGFSTNFVNDPESYLRDRPVIKKRGEINHLFSIHTIQSFLHHYLAFDRDREVKLEDWLTFPEQSLVEVTGGKIFYDGLGELIELRKKLSYYPHDIWLYAMRVQWGKINNELSFHARAGARGDEIGSRVLAAKMVNMIIHMAFLLERKYSPYSKWYTTAFQKLPISRKLKPMLMKIVTSPDWEVRQNNIALAHKVLAEKHNQLGITKPLSTDISDFYGRGFAVLNPVPYIKELEKNIQDKKLRNMKYVLGKIDQFVDHTKINQEEHVYRRFRFLIE